MIPELALRASESRALPEELAFLGYRINPLTADEVIEQIDGAVTERRRLIMGNLNLHAMAVMFESPAMARLLSQPDALVMIDSMPLIFALNLAGRKVPRSKRTTSLEFYDAMFRIGAAQGWKFAYVGARQEILPLGLAALRDRFPGLQIDGRPGFFDMRDDAGQRALAEWMAAESFDVVIVGMGMPRQEEWIAQIQHQVDSRVFLPAGAYLDYQVGVQHPAPRWMGQVGLEWAYRLARAPRRLGHRYLIEPFILFWRLTTQPHPQRKFLKDGEKR